MAATLIVEDGTGLEYATSYIDIGYLDAYWQNVGYSSSSEMDTTGKIQLLNRSANLLDGYPNSWQGVPYNTNQALAFPRYNFYDIYGNLLPGLPTEIKKAQAVMAYYLDNIGISAIAPVGNVNGDIKSFREKIGLIDESTTYQDATSKSGKFVRIPEIDALFRKFKGNSAAFNPGRMGGSDAGTFTNYGSFM